MKSTPYWQLKQGGILSALSHSPVKLYNKLQYAHPKIADFNPSWYKPLHCENLKCKPIYAFNTYTPTQRLFKLLNFIINAIKYLAESICAENRLVIILLVPYTASDFILDKLLQRISITCHAVFKERLIWSVCHHYAELNTELELYLQDPTVAQLILVGLDSCLTKQGQALYQNRLAEEVILGEAAAWVRLQRCEQHPPCNQLAAFHSVKTALYTLDDKQKTRNLQLSLSAACTQAQWTPVQVKQCCRIAPITPDTTLSWHDASHQLWQSVPPTTWLTPCLGEIGHASLPLCLALAAEIPHPTWLISLSDHQNQHATYCITGTKP